MTLRLSAAQLSLLRAGDPDVTAKVERAARGRQADARGKAWEREIEKHLDVYGWLWSAVPKPTFVSGRMHGIPRGKKGVPDYLLTHPSRGITCHRELKTGDAVLSKEQRLWRDSLVASGMDWAVWHPKDRDAIHAFIAGR